MNLPGIVQPEDNDREIVDLLFFPTGGGKTEAYWVWPPTLVLRRLRHPGITSAGLSVLMRYTLRLLTLDQLSRAATLICALELERQQDVEKLGPWPLEIGLWVGKAATPNVMGPKAMATVTQPAPVRSPSRTTTASHHRFRWKIAPGAARSSRQHRFASSPIRIRHDLRVTCVNRHLPLHGQAIADRGRGRGHLSTAALFSHRHGGQVCGDAVDRRCGPVFGRVDRYDRRLLRTVSSDAGSALPVDRLLPPT